MTWPRAKGSSTAAVNLSTGATGLTESAVAKASVISAQPPIPDNSPIISNKATVWKNIQTAAAMMANGPTTQGKFFFP